MDWFSILSTISSWIGGHPPGWTWLQPITMCALAKSLHVANSNLLCWHNGLCSSPGWSIDHCVSLPEGAVLSNVKDTYSPFDAHAQFSFHARVLKVLLLFFSACRLHAQIAPLSHLSTTCFSTTDCFAERCHGLQLTRFSAGVHSALPLHNGTTWLHTHWASHPESFSVLLPWQRQQCKAHLCGYALSSLPLLVV